MSKEEIVMDVFWIFITWGCGALFYAIGGHATHADYPVHFWSGDEIPKDRCLDIPAYNKELAHIWKIYSVPLFISGITFIWFPVISAVVMSLSICIGTIWLIKSYRKIEKKYIIKQK